MITRRSMMICLASTVMVAGINPAIAHLKKHKVASKYRPQTVRFSGYKPGTVIVNTKQHFLYLQLPGGKARRYGIGVGRAGLKFKGSANIGRKAKWPRWTPTKNMIRREPEKYARFADGVEGGPKNPLGSRALYLYRNGNDSLYRIHGTTQPSSIGRSVSNGCIRMINAHVEDLYERVRVGASVIVK